MQAESRQFWKSNEIPLSRNRRSIVNFRWTSAPRSRIILSSNVPEPSYRSNSDIQRTSAVDNSLLGLPLILPSEAHREGTRPTVYGDDRGGAGWNWWLISPTEARIETRGRRGSRVRVIEAVAFEKRRNAPEQIGENTQSMQYWIV